MPERCRVAVLCVLAVLAALPSIAEELALPCSRDNTLFEDREGNVSNGRGQHLFVGKTLRGPIRRALLAFDLDAVPAGATIIEVRLSITVSQTQGGPQPLSLHRILSPWGEGASDANDPEGQGIEAEEDDATWLHGFYPDSLWQLPGGDLSNEASAVLEVDGGGAYTWASTPELIGDVQRWLEKPEENFGWAVVGNEATPKTAKRFFSRQHEVEERRPVLHVRFEHGGATAVRAGSWGAIKGTAAGAPAICRRPYHPPYQ